MHNTALTFFQRINKQPPFFSKFYPIYKKERKHLEPVSGYIYEFPLKEFQYDKKQNRQHLYMSDLEFRPIHKFFRVLISSIKYMKTQILTLFLYMYTIIHHLNKSTSRTPSIL